MVKIKRGILGRVEKFVPYFMNSIRFAAFLGHLPQGLLVCFGSLITAFCLLIRLQISIKVYSRIPTFGRRILYVRPKAL